MSNDTLAAPAGRSLGGLDHWLRTALVRRLAPLAGGRLTIRDPWGSWQAGGPGGLEAQMDVHDGAVYRDLALGGALGAAEAYLDGRWDSPDLTTLFRLLVRNTDLIDGVGGAAARLGTLIQRLAHARRANTRAGSRRNIREHYDLGNELFALFLDETLTYSAGIFEEPRTSLEAAQTAKLDRICRKLGLEADDRVIEIGSGWGSFAIHAAGRYGCRVTTTTVSQAQLELARERIARAGLADRIEVLLADYRDLTGRYDKLVSIEMIEAVGHEFLPTYFGTVARLLEPHGQALIQAITMPDRRYARYRRHPDFIQRYVFPGSCVPALGALLTAMGEGSDLKLVHLEDIGPHYATTLRHWRERFHARLDAVRALGYPERFVRLWTYYLCYCEAGFAERYLGDAQLLLHRPLSRAAPPLAALPEVAP